MREHYVLSTLITLFFFIRILNFFQSLNILNFLLYRNILKLFLARQKIRIWQYIVIIIINAKNSQLLKIWWLTEQDIKMKSKKETYRISIKEGVEKYE